MVDNDTKAKEEPNEKRARSFGNTAEGEEEDDNFL